MKTKKPEITFDAAALVARVEGFAAGHAPARERTVNLPPPVKAMPARQIRALRLQLGCTQMEFAALPLTHGSRALATTLAKFRAGGTE